MENLYRFCRGCLEIDITQLERIKRQQQCKSLIAVFGAIELHTRPIIQQSLDEQSITPSSLAWLEETVNKARKLLERLMELPPKRKPLEMLLLWCTSNDTAAELEEERASQEDVDLDFILDEVLCRSFAILDSLYWYHRGNDFEIRPGMDLKQAKFDFLGCSCDLRHQVRVLPNDVTKLRIAAKHIFQERLKWFQREMQFQKQRVSDTYDWKLFALKHEYNHALVEKEGIIEDQQMQIAELSSLLERTMKRNISHTKKVNCLIAYEVNTKKGEQQVTSH